MEYTIVSGSQPDAVSTKVNEFLAEGWQLYGSLVGHSFEEHSMGFFAQALTREKAEDAGPVEFKSSGVKQGHAMLKSY